MKSSALLSCCLLLGLSSGAQAALVNRGGGLLYDTVLNVTWLQDANYAKTSGYDADGLFNGDRARAWAFTLVYHDSVRNVDYSDWRLATNTPLNGNNFTYHQASDGSSDVGHNITSSHSEMSYMYYVNLGLKGSIDVNNNFTEDYGIFGNGTVGGQADVGPVRNLQSATYWSGRDTDFFYSAWAFRFDYGLQHRAGMINEYYAWAVRPGDVFGENGVVPEPGAVGLVGVGLLGLLGAARRPRYGTPR